MACIIDARSGEVRLPPDGRIMNRASNVQQFMTGVKFDADPSWIGPVRKMHGRGDNDDRSFVYENRPSVPSWPEPVIYHDTSTYDFYDLAFRGIHAQKHALVGFAHFAWNGCDLPRGFPWYVTTGEPSRQEGPSPSHGGTSDFQSSIG